MTALDILTRWLVDLLSPDRVVCRWANETDEGDE